MIHINTKISLDYAKDAIKTCKANGLSVSPHLGFQEEDMPDAWRKMGFDNVKLKGKGGAATASHIALWKKISKSNETAIILEHDALLLRKPDIDIPDGSIVALGYKVKSPHKYNIMTDNERLVDRNHHGGAHAYAITPNTAKMLIEEIKEEGLSRMIDNQYFLRLAGPKPKAKLQIIDPIAALGWIRESTIWKTAAVDNYKPLLESFKDNFHSNEDLGLKGRP